MRVSTMRGKNFEFTGTGITQLGNKNGVANGPTAINSRVAAKRVFRYFLHQAGKPVVNVTIVATQLLAIEVGFGPKFP